MKLSKLLKKVSVAVSVLMIAGMLAACSSPSGGSSSSGSGSGDGNGTGGTPTQQGGTTGKDGGSGKDKNTTTGEYTVKYDGIVIGNYDEEAMKKMPEGAGIINGKEVTMTSDYVDELLAMGKTMMGKEYIAVVFYQGNPVTGLTQAELTSSDLGLVKGTDYQISSDNKVVVLTESGAQKMQGSGNNSSSEESDSDDEGKIVLTYTNGNDTSISKIGASYFEAWVKSHGLIEGTDYVLDSTGKKGTLTKSGYEKLEG